MLLTFLGLSFGAALAILGFPVTTYQYWVLLGIYAASLFAATN